MNEIIFIFSFIVKPENQERYEASRKKSMEITKGEDGTLLYEVFRDKNGVYCQHERYANEEALWVHMQNTAESLAEWFAVAEIKQIITLGNVSDKVIEQYGLKDVYKPYARVEK